MKNMFLALSLIFGYLSTATATPKCQVVHVVTISGYEYAEANGIQGEDEIKKLYTDEAIKKYSEGRIVSGVVQDLDFLFNSTYMYAGNVTDCPGKNPKQYFMAIQIMDENIVEKYIAEFPVTEIKDGKDSLSFLTAGENKIKLHTYLPTSDSGHMATPSQAHIVANGVTYDIEIFKRP